jgi:hypothetical protein
MSGTRNNSQGLSRAQATAPHASSAATTEWFFATRRGIELGDLKRVSVRDIKRYRELHDRVGHRMDALYSRWQELGKPTLQTIERLKVRPSLQRQRSSSYTNFLTGTNSSARCRPCHEGPAYPNLGSPFVGPRAGPGPHVFCARGGVFCHRSVVDRDTTKGGATPPLRTTDPCPSRLATPFCEEVAPPLVV